MHEGSLRLRRGISLEFGCGLTFQLTSKLKLDLVRYRSPIVGGS